MMAGIRARDTRPELRVRKALHALGFRYRLHASKLPGKPDIVLRKHRAAILVHGCFWHRHANCHFATTPASNPEFWAAKFAGNVERDARGVAALAKMGWRVAVVWECGLRRRDVSDVTGRLANWILSSEDRTELP